MASLFMVFENSFFVMKNKNNKKNIKNIVWLSFFFFLIMKNTNNIKNTKFR